MRLLHLILSAASLLGALGIGSSATAAPALESDCVVHNPTAGPLATAYPSEDCSQLFVLPPAVGTARVTAVAPKQNLDFCPAVRKVGEVATVTLTSAKTVADKIAKMVADFDPLNAEYRCDPCTDARSISYSQ